MTRFFLLISILLTIANVRGLSQSKSNLEDEKEEVLATVELFFESLAKKDTTTLSRIMTENGQYYATGKNEDGNFIIRRSHKKYIEKLPKIDGTIVERIWEPKIMVQDEIATLWAEYDLYLDGEFSHCGVDAFSLIKKDGQWLIAGTVFSIKKENCPTSPLGPLNEK